MARGNGRKNYNHKHNKNKANPKFQKKKFGKPNRYMMVKNNIEKNKESEENLRKNQLSELKYQEKFEARNSDSNESENEQEMEENPMDQLLSTMHKTKKESAIDSSTDEEDEEDEEDEAAEEEISETEQMLEESDSDVESDGNDIISGLESNDEENESVHNETTNFRPEESINTEFLNESMENELRIEPEQPEEEFDSDVETEEKTQSTIDPFCNHFNFDLSSKLLESIASKKSEIFKLNWPITGNLMAEIPRAGSEPSNKKQKTILGSNEVHAVEGQMPNMTKANNCTTSYNIKSQIAQNIIEANKDNSDSVTPLQEEILSLIKNYQDFYYPSRNFDNGEEIRLTYCIQALNHVLKTRTKILHHNAKVAKLLSTKKHSVIPDSCRDQGLVRPKVLILLPFRDSAYRVVNMLLDLLNPNERSSTANYKRFVDEFTGQTLYFPKKNPKPEDYEQTFHGNTEDTFRIGISITKKSMKLFAPFYASDILIASPLGLRLIIGAPGEKEREYDFLASVELLILDQMELFLAQNWDHLLYIFEHLHLQPQSRQNTDFSRVRSWCLNGWSRFYRQTLLFSSYDLPEFRSLFNNKCQNYQGKIRTANPVANGTMRHVQVQIPQTFHRIEMTSIESSFDTRFEYFTNSILPQFKAATMAHCLIYIPSYFDYVRIRNYYKKEELNFTQICEYTKDKKISRARTLFFHGGTRFMLYSERAHFFRRIRIKGVRHLIMYQPPVWSNFYPEMVNLMQEINQNPNDSVGSSMTVTVLYSKYDLLQLSAIVGTEQVTKMIRSNKQTHLFTTN